MEQNLDDIALFLAIADAGGLAGAARATGQSPPTLSRRMTALERRLGQRLFQRGRRGYTLTSAGLSLLDESAPLRDLQSRLARWADADPKPCVRITAGHWTARFLARNIDRFWTPADGWVPEFAASNATVDIARREADIGIRNRRPDQSWLAGRATLPVQYAEYGLGSDITGYLVLTEGSPTTPSDRWIRQNRPDRIVTAGSDARLNLDLALAGLGRIVLPTFAGDAENRLRRLSAPIDEIGHEEWLVAHHDARHDPPVRAALDALTALLTDRRLRPAT